MTENTVIPEDYTASLFSLTDKVAVITGASSGLGAAIAMGYAQLGVNVVLADVNEAGSADVLNTIVAQGGKGTVAYLDVTDREQCFRLAEKVKSECGSVDILVNSAGSAYRCPAEEFPEDKFNFILDLNLKGTYFCCQAFGNVMLEQQSGSIINIASIGSFNAYPLASAYLASKGAVLQITRSLALEWRDRGVRVNGIGPTLMESPLTTAAASSTSETADFIKARMIRPRLGLPQELIGTAVFLASNASDLVTGHVVMCDDGYLTA